LYWYRSHSRGYEKEIKQSQLTGTSAENRVTSAAISPDGKYLAYTDPHSVYVKSLLTGEVRRLPPPEEFKDRGVPWDIAPRWFPDSVRFLATAHGGMEDAGQWNPYKTSIWAYSILGSEPRKVRENATAYAPSPDGNTIAFGANPGRRGDREIWLMDADGAHARRLVTVDEEEGIDSVNWEPSGRRIAYTSKTMEGEAFLSRDIEGESVMTLLSPAEMKNAQDLYLLSDRRVIYTQSESGSWWNKSTCDVREKRITGGSAQSAEASRLLTRWNGFCAESISATTDGRIAVLERAGHPTINMAELAEDGGRIVRQRHFTLSDSSDLPLDWTSDNKSLIFYSDRGSRHAFYQQALDEDTPKQLATLTAPFFFTHLTPDKKAVLYLSGNPFGPPMVQPVMLLPLDGKPVKQIFAAKFFSAIICAQAPSGSCAVAEPTEDRRMLIVSHLDLVNGRGEEIARFALDPDKTDWMIDLSPDGEHLAITRSGAGPIHVLSLGSKLLQQVNIEGYDNFNTLNWDARGNGFFVSDESRGDTSVLHVDLQGKIKVLWVHPGHSGPIVSQSPDGRHLALVDWAETGNIWMLEDF
jgi:Tol biopolymer transport system component